MDPSLFDEYAWSGRTIQYHRAQIRAALGFHEPTVEEDNLIAWLAEDVCPLELSEYRLREALLARCRAERMEPPVPGRGERILGAARSAFEREFKARITGRLLLAAALNGDVLRRPAVPGCPPVGTGSVHGNDAAGGELIPALYLGGGLHSKELGVR